MTAEEGCATGRTALVLGLPTTFVLLPMFFVISLADGFMEELLFRGLFLKKLGRIIGTAWANVVTHRVRPRLL